MGCLASKLEELPAVELCRERCNLIETALRQSYALGDAHVAYMQSLNSVGRALLNYYEELSHHHHHHHHHIDIADSSSSSSSDSDSATAKPPPQISTAVAAVPPLSPFDKSSAGSLSVSNSYEVPVIMDSCYHNSDFPGYRCFKDKYTNLSTGFSDSAKSPPPPPPPITSAWDFLNFFQMPDHLTDVTQFGADDAESELSSEKVKFAGKCIGDDVNVVAPEEEKVGSNMKRDEDEEEDKEEQGGNSMNEMDKRRGVYEGMCDIKVLFDRAAESGDHISTMLNGSKFHFSNQQNSSVQRGFIYRTLIIRFNIQFSTI